MERPVGADPADELAGLDEVPRLHGEIGHVVVAADDAGAVVDEEANAAAQGLPAPKHAARGRGDDGVAGGAGEIQPGVVLGRWPEVVGAQESVAGGDDAFHGEVEELGPEAFGAPAAQEGAPGLLVFAEHVGVQQGTVVVVEFDDLGLPLGILDVDQRFAIHDRIPGAVRHGDDERDGADRGQRVEAENGEETRLLLPHREDLARECD